MGVLILYSLIWLETMSYSLYQDLLTFNIASKCIEGWWALSRDGKFKRKVKRTGINFYPARMRKG